MTSIEATSQWRDVSSHVAERTLEDLFRADDERDRVLVCTAGNLAVDFTRQKVDREIIDALVQAAQECDIRGALARMFSGAQINVTERRSVGHVALRMMEGETFDVGGVNVVPTVRATLDAMSTFAKGVRDGTVTGCTGRAFSAVVNIGIGGSDLGPRLVHDAMRHLCHDRIESRFVANVDPEDFATNVEDLDPAQTLVIVSSKTFTTTETLLNANLAADWLRRHLGDEAVAQHIVAVSADERAVRASGLGAGIVFPLWDWVGGRYSIGSAVGLSAMIAVGAAAFRSMLSGMRDIDEHVRTSDPRNNAALLMALIGIWNHSKLGYSTRAVIPYAHGLRRLPAYLQQLMMESNGKSVRADGTSVGIPTSPVVWGDEGTNAQHAFMQLLHQGTSVVPVDFIGFARPSVEPTPNRVASQRALFSNMVAQAQALAFGRTSAGSLEPHRYFSGNRPSTVITAPELTPQVLGQIIALYEHAVFYEGVLLGINSFDQWGVELGKEMASTLMNAAQQRVDEISHAERAGLRLMTWFEANSRAPKDR